MAARYGGRLKRFLKLNLSNASDVPDLAQEIFLRLLRVPNPQDIRSPEAYLFTIASHVVQQHGQKQANVPESLDLMESLGSLPIVSEDDPTDQVAFMQRLSSLQSLLNQLPPRVAMALIMHRLVGHSIADIARELGVAEVTVKKYLARALVHCRLAAVDGSTLKQSDSSLMADRSLEGKL
jgi:RNA polymerase sigma-70 factor (ECF subfamily)